MPLSLSDLPSPTTDATGWPWTEAPAAPDPDASEWPSITVVTPSYNQGEFIEETIRSVLLQGYSNLQYIVIDGGSTDGTVDILERYTPWIDHWISEPDNGQVDAINKGLARSSGTLFNWINSDDLLMPGALQTIARCSDGVDAVAGACVNFSDSHTEILQSMNLDPVAMIHEEGGTIFQQPALWLETAKIQACGGIDPSMDYAFDWDLALRYFALFPRIHYVQHPLARFRIHASSKTSQEPESFAQERTCAVRKLLSDRRFRHLHPEARRRLRTIQWWDQLEEIHQDDSLSSWERRWKILKKSLDDPAIRWSRMTLGALR
jgi:glycosyltransferase involved in cell wall biosynthesis